MLDADAFLTTLYVMVDDFCKVDLPAEVQPGPKASLSRSEVEAGLRGEPALLGAAPG